MVIVFKFRRHSVSQCLIMSHNVPQCPTMSYNGDVFDNVIHANVRLSDVTDSVNLDSDHLPVIFHILDPVRAKDVWN
jgi:hypothetical protein